MNLASASKELAKHLARFRASASNVHGVGIGQKLIGGTPTGETSIRIHVTRKIPFSQVPREERFPISFAGFKTDVVETSRAFLASPQTITLPVLSDAEKSMCTGKRTRQQRPLIGGISLSHKDTICGTLGYFCRSLDPNEAGKVFVLGNNHVLAKLNLADVGDEIRQPATGDAGFSQHRIGSFARCVPITFGEDSGNRMDAAIALLNPEVDFNPSICSIGKVQGTRDAIEGMRVAKHGRTTGLTEGVVSDVEYHCLVGLDTSDSQNLARFTGQIRIERSSPFPMFADGGDSGALVVEAASNAAVGLYFAGSADGSYGLASPIKSVLAELNIELL